MLHVELADMNVPDENVVNELWYLCAGHTHKTATRPGAAQGMDALEGQGASMANLLPVHRCTMYQPD